MASLPRSSPAHGRLPVTHAAKSYPARNPLHRGHPRRTIAGEGMPDFVLRGSDLGPSPPTLARRGRFVLIWHTKNLVPSPATEKNLQIG